MIQVYKASNTDFTMNGDLVIFPTSCEVEMNLNGEWELELEHPIDPDGNYKLLAEGNVLCVPTPVSKRQLFRIYSKKRTQKTVTVYARPIFYDSADEVFLLDTRPTSKTGQEALDILTKGTKYSGKSNIKTVTTAYYVNKNLMQALQDDDEDGNSFLARWGGEIIYDNYKVIINSRAGGDYGVRAEFGRNIDSIKETVDCDDIVTRIIPQAYNGYMLDGSKPWVDSPNINKYPIVYSKLVKFSDVKLAADATGDEEGFATLAELRAELKRRAKAEFDAGCDLPSCNYVIDMVDLSKMEEYKEYSMLEDVGLGDTIHCKYQPLDIETTARVIRIKYDCILEKNIEEELGDAEYDYFTEIKTSTYNATNSLSNILNTDGSIRGDVVSGFLNALNVTLTAQKNVAQKTDVRAILFEDLDEESDTYGALAIGTLGVQISTTRTADGKDWDWTTAITATGIVANAIVTGTMYADRIRGGTLKLGGANDENGTAVIYDEDGVRGLTLNRSGTNFFYDSTLIGRISRTIAKANDVDKYGVSLTAVNSDGFVAIGSVSSSNRMSPYFLFAREAQEYSNQYYSPGLNLLNPSIMANFYLRPSGSSDNVAHVFSSSDGLGSVAKIVQKGGRFSITDSTNTVLERWNDTGREIVVTATTFNLSSTSVVTSSDERLKTNIEVVDIDALDVLNSIQLYSFDWIESGKHEQLGFIAQQLEAEASKDFVHINEETGVYQVEQFKLIPYLVKAVQELSAQVTELQAQIAMLSGEEVELMTLSEDECERWKPTKYTDDEKQAFVDATKVQREEEVDEDTGESDWVTM